jgi:hypothetical protein
MKLFILSDIFNYDGSGLIFKVINLVLSKILFKEHFFILCGDPLGIDDVLDFSY